MRLELAYDGTGFSGWARQPGLRTVQGELEAALETVLGRYGPAPRLVVAGRTDAGVHARRQVAHLDIADAQLRQLSRAQRGRGGAATAGAAPATPPAGSAAVDPGATLARKLNGIAGLRSDVVVHAATLAPPGFDARFSPIWRRYRYRIADTLAARDPLQRNHTVWLPRPLDEQAMDAAARALLGLHDWAAYCRPREGSTTIRELQDFAWHRDAEGVLVAELQADAFCHSMVRALVGATVAVGEGALPADRLIGIRSEALRTSEFKVMPARGLTLWEVGYPPDAELAARAERTRARRDQE